MPEHKQSGEDKLINSLTSIIFHMFKKALKVHSCKLYNKKYLIASTQVKNTNIF